MSFQLIFILCLSHLPEILNQEETCVKESVSSCNIKTSDGYNRYKKDEKWNGYLRNIDDSYQNYNRLECDGCSCLMGVIEKDLLPWKNGIEKNMMDQAKSFGTFYQIVNHKLYRESSCLFPFRCAGIEHFLLEIINDLPDMEFVINTRDWPQSPKQWKPIPILSFSKTVDYWDIFYPAWSFWEGGPAISLYPTGLGRWDEHRKSISKAAKKWPWSKKKSLAFFRGSRTNGERDALILLSRSNAQLVDAKYTKNQAWKSHADTLYEEPASEVSLEDHCQYKYLFNFRGVAASFRLKHLFLCKSLVFHVGNEWNEFFYSLLKPWIHYIPVNSDYQSSDLQSLLQFAISHDAKIKKIADEGFHLIWTHLTMDNVKCYWRHLMEKLSSLQKYKIVLNETLHQIQMKSQ